VLEILFLLEIFKHVLTLIGHEMKIYNPQPDGRSGKNGFTDGDFEKFGSYIS
jgi:hypothetical protein